MPYRVLLLCIVLLTALAGAAQRDMPDNPLHHPTIGQDIVASLTGSVLSADGHPLGNVRVEIRDMMTGTVIASTYTRANGSFEFPNLSHTRYQLVATAGTQQADQMVEPGLDDNVVLQVAAGDGNGSTGPATVSVGQLKVPDKARNSFHKAEEAFHKNKMAQAEEHLEKALKIFPRYAQALTLRGIMELSQNHTNQARASLEQAVQDDANYGMAYVALGSTYNSLGRFNDALRILQRGGALVPNVWQVHFETARALLATEQYKEALHEIDRAGALCPSNFALIHLVRAHALLGLKDYRQAIPELEAYLGGQPNGPTSDQARQTLDQVRAFTAGAPK